MIVNRTELIRKRTKNQNNLFSEHKHNDIHQTKNEQDKQINFYSNQQNLQKIKKYNQQDFHQNYQRFSKTQNFTISNALNQLNFNSIASSKIVTRNDGHSRQGTIRSNNKSCSKSRSSSFQKNTSKLQVDLSNKQLKQFKLQLPNGINYSQICSLNLCSNNIREVLAGCLSNFVNLKQFLMNQNNLQKISFPYNKFQLKRLQLDNNSLTNLNLQHIQKLEFLSAKSNKLIFITIPRSIKIVNLNENQLSNIYFIEKCRNIEQLRINSNFVYDLNFNVDHESILAADKSNFQSVKFPNLKIIQAANNKISYLNGFHNIKNVSCLNVDSNQVNFTRENINQLFQVSNLQELSLRNNPLQGPYDIQSSYKFIISKLQNLVLLNNQSPNNFIAEDSQLNDESTIRHEQFNSDDEGVESPYRLFIDQSQKKIQKKNKEWIFTLGDCIDDDQNNNDNDRDKNKEIFQKMTENQQQNYSSLQLIQQKQTKINLKTTNTKTKFIFDQSQKYLKTLGKIGIVPPQVIRHCNTSNIISKRLDQDQDEYEIISKLFQNRNGVVYIKKFYKWNQNQEYEVKEDEMIDTGFLSLQIDLSLFKKLKNQEIEMISLIGQKNAMLTYQPNIFSCYHLIASTRQSQLSKQNINNSVINEQNLRFYYLVESKNI